MGNVGHLTEELEEVAAELDEACQAPDVLQQPEVARARALVEEARSALSSAFLSRRALVMAKDAIRRAQAAAEAALSVSRVLRERSAELRTQGADVRTMASEARRGAARLRDWADRIAELQPGHPAQVTIDSGLPADLPEKAAIEAAVTRTLAAVNGRWAVVITVAASGQWWGLRVRGPSVDWVGTLLDPGERTPTAIASRLEPLVRLAQAEALYRRSRAGARREVREKD